MVLECEDPSKYGRDIPFHNQVAYYNSFQLVLFVFLQQKIPKTYRFGYYLTPEGFLFIKYDIIRNFMQKRIDN